MGTQSRSPTWILLRQLSPAYLLKSLIQWKLNLSTSFYCPAGPVLSLSFSYLLNLSFPPSHCVMLLPEDTTRAWHADMSTSLPFFSQLGRCASVVPSACNRYQHGPFCSHSILHSTLTLPGFLWSPSPKLNFPPCPWYMSSFPFLISSQASITFNILHTDFLCMLDICECKLHENTS